MSLRVAVILCIVSFGWVVSAAQLGLQNYVVPDGRLSASSEYDPNHGAKRCRLNLARVGDLRGAWAARYNDANQWLQVDLLHPYQIDQLATQGRQDLDQWVTSYQVACSMDGATFSSVKKTNEVAAEVFTANTDRNTVITNTLNVPLVCRFVRVIPITWNSHISMRLELYGQGPVTDVSDDAPALGLEKYGIPDARLSASSEYNPDHGAKRCRINLAREGNLRGAWAARYNDVNQWLQVSLLDPYRVTKLATQGRQDLSQWVTGYKVACSMDGANFNTVQDVSTGSDQVFTANTDSDTLVTNTLSVPPICRFVRILPTSWQGHISMRLELYGEGPTLSVKAPYAELEWIYLN